MDKHMKHANQHNKSLKYELSWYCMQRRMVFCYRRFKPSCRSHLQRTSSPLRTICDNLSVTKRR